jgi:flagellar hook-length control protein FliK
VEIELDKLTALGAGQPISISTELKSLIEQANKLIAAKAIDPQGASQSLVNLSNHDKSATSGVAASETFVSTGKVLGDSAEGQSILGEAKGESSTKSGLTPAQIAETTSQNSGGQNSGSLSHGADLKTAKLAVVMTTGAEGLDIDTSESKSVSQGLNNPAFIRSEAQVQYQVSIKPSGEPAQQMQEMIQKFSPVMQQQLLTMVKQGVQHAEIRLDPPELGHMMVRIQVHGDQTQVQFQVMQHQTKDLVEQAIPRLRELLAEQGMQLTDSNVSQGGSGREQDAGDGNSDQGHGFATDVDEIAAEESLLASNNATSYRSGIDYYA